MRVTLNRWTRPLLWLAGLLLKLNFATCRVTHLTPWEIKDRSIGVTWHRASIFFLYYTRKKKPAIMVSQSRDGDILSAFISQLRSVPVRGSSSRGGLAALKELAAGFKSGRFRHAATVADGPQGPPYVAKEGMIMLSVLSGAPLIPMIWSCDRAWIFRRAWDKTMIPKPFARVWMEMAPPISYPAKMSKEEMEAARKALQNQLEEMRRRLDALAGHRDPL
ncbi:MAG: lysophospholipid acyltransferase family protein [Desulfarculales bacterium]|nr:lysophospholipid acyltransferase family protein [Desulfarculales bacterium]